MQPIIPPINPNSTGPNVANLIECLLLLVERGIFKTFATPNRPTPDELKQLATKARQDLAQQFFGEAVKRLVWDFQIQQGLGDNVGGVVEDKTAARMNEILRSLGVDLDTQDYEVLGTVSNESGRALSQLLVQAFDRDLRREELLGAAQTDASEDRKGPGYLNLAGRPWGRELDARPSAIGGRLGWGKPDDLVREAGGGWLE